MNLKFYLLIFLFGIISIIPSEASEHEKLFTLEELTTNSSLIVKGKIISINCYEKEGGRFYSDISILVTEVIKGETEKERVLNLTYYGGTINGLTTFVLNFPVFCLNEESILFLNKIESKNSFKIKYKITGLNQGKFNLLNESTKVCVSRDHSMARGLLVKREDKEFKFRNNSSLSLSEFIGLIRLFL